MIYMRVCEECLLDLGGLEWPEEPNWIKPKKKTVRELNNEVVAEWNRLTGTTVPLSQKGWQHVGSLLKVARSHYTQREILGALTFAAQDTWVKENNVSLAPVLSSDHLARWARQVAAQGRVDAKVDKDKLAAEKLRMVEELFGADQLTSDIEEQITLAETFDDLEAIRNE